MNQPARKTKTAVKVAAWTLAVTAVAVLCFFFLRSMTLSTTTLTLVLDMAMALSASAFLTLGAWIIWNVPDNLTTTRYSYDDEGKLVSVTDPYGRISTCSYDGRR